MFLSNCTQQPVAKFQHSFYSGCENCINYVITHWITYRIAGNFRWVQIFEIFADRPASAKIKTAKRWKLMTSLRAYVEYRCEHDDSLQSVCPLNGCCKEESASYCTKYQQNRKRRSEDVASTGRGVVRASAFRENKNRENFF